MPDNAAAQLRRVLSLIPELADDQEHQLADVAEKIGVDSLTLIKDLESLATRFDEPGGFVEGVQLYLGSDTVSVVSNHFRRPMRPTISELRAVELGLTMLRTELPPDERSCAESARDKLRRTIGRLPSGHNLGDLYAESELPAASEHLSTLRTAFRARHKVRLDYLKADSDEMESRIVQPYAFVIASGSWYIIAFCEQSEGLRIFRLDRITGVTPAEEEYEVPASFRLSDAVRDHKALGMKIEGTMKVRYSPRIARWIAEREEGEHASDGSFVVEHPLADPDWAVRHVLQYGGEAEVLEPAELRVAIRGRLQRASGMLQ